MRLCTQHAAAFTAEEGSPSLPANGLSRFCPYLCIRSPGIGLSSTRTRTDTCLLSYHRTNVHVALKICRSDSETREAAKAEIEVLNFTRSHHRQSAHIVALLDHFEHASLAYPGQMHIVLVFELLGPNLLDFLNQHMMRAQRGEVEKGEAGGLPLALVKRFADQILEGTAFLHDLCRHIHTDLKVCTNWLYSLSKCSTHRPGSFLTAGKPRHLHSEH